MSERCGTSKSEAVLRAATAAGSGSERRTALEARARTATSKLLSRLSLPPNDVEAVWSRTRRAGGHRGGAWLDPGRRYRYLLWRAWGDAGRFALFILLNPSTAEQDTNDPTVERCERRARALGFDGLLVANLFALRSTHPCSLRLEPAPMGPRNGAAIALAQQLAAQTICGWGAHGCCRRRGQALCERLRRPIYHLGLTRDGQPRHPLYVPYSVQPRIWLDGRR
jgi:hypothetical protein